jgi:ATP/maltotriose-dependent transcriptional regulator MalT
LSRQAGSYMNEQFMRPLEPLLQRARDAVGPSADRLTADGARLSLDELVAEALAEPGSEPNDPLTRREHDVVELVTQGLTNVEIGQHLFISKRTVESHIENVKQKLALHTRPQITAWGLDRYGPSPDP